MYSGWNYLLDKDLRFIKEKLEEIKLRNKQFEEKFINNQQD